MTTQTSQIDPELQEFLQDEDRVFRFVARFAGHLARNGAVGRALNLLSTLSNLHPNDGYLFTARGFLHMRQGEIEEAIPLLRRGIELDPDDVAGHASLGECLIETGELDDALDHFEEAVELGDLETDKFARRARSFIPVVEHLRDQVDERGDEALDEMRARLAQLRSLG
ncbi:MAG: tetratricopeptide repeat protein [Pseudomonadota bacterium]